LACIAPSAESSTAIGRVEGRLAQTDANKKKSANVEEIERQRKELVNHVKNQILEMKKDFTEAPLPEIDLLAGSERGHIEVHRQKKQSNALDYE
jgi:hypothetical protein